MQLFLCPYLLHFHLTGYNVVINFQFSNETYLRIFFLIIIYIDNLMVVKMKCGFKNWAAVDYIYECFNVHIKKHCLLSKGSRRYHEVL